MGRENQSSKTDYGRNLNSDEGIGHIGSDVMTRHTKIAWASFRNGSIFHYCAGRPGNATRDTQTKPNVVSRTKLISQLAKCGRGRDALRIYREMREEGLKPKTYTYVAALKACKSLADLEAGKAIHAQVIESGDHSDKFVATTLVDMYMKCGSVADARQVFERMPFRDVALWNAMIMGYAQMDMGESGLQLYIRMQHEGFTPDARTFVAALKSCGSLAAQELGKQLDGVVVKTGSLQKGRAIHRQLARSGFEWDVFVASTLVDMYAKCGSMVDACQVFENMPYRNVVAWTAMIMGYTQMEKGKWALELYERMQHQGFTPNDRTFVAALKACSSLAVQDEGKTIDGELMALRCLARGRAIHSQIVKCSLESDIFVANSLVGMYVKCGSMVDAQYVFEKMPYRDVVSWNTMIMGYAQMEKGELALQFYMQMQHEGLTPNAQTFVAALKACGSLAPQKCKQAGSALVKIGCLENVKAIHSQVAKSGFEANIFIANTLVDMYVKSGSMADAHQVFEGMPHRDVVSWTAMIMGYAQREDGELALQLYARMQCEGFTPDSHTFVAALMACSSLASLEIGKEIHAEIRRVGLEGDAFVATCLIDMYSKCGSMVDAQRLFDDASPVMDVVRWNALIAGYSGQGDNECVFNLFERMQQEGIQPVGSTFVSVLTVCSHAGLVDKGQNYFQLLCSDHEIYPANEHYSCMVDLLGRAGQMEEAVTMVKKMPFMPDIVTWTAILDACRMWNNVRVARCAFDCAVRLDGKQAAAYVLMTNMYACAHMWEESAKIQAMRTNVEPWKKSEQQL